MRKRTNCYECKFYRVTWEQDFPHACDGFGFKTRRFPAEVVFESSERECLLFSQKERRRKREEKSDDDGGKGWIG